MDTIKSRKVLISISLGLILVILTMVYFIDVQTFKKNYTESVVASYSVLGSEPVRNIEYALKYGKNIDQFIGMASVLTSVREKSKDILEVQIILADGTTSYSLKNDPLYHLEPEAVKQMFVQNEQAIYEMMRTHHNVVSFSGNHYVILPIQNSDNINVAGLVLVISGSVIDQEVLRYTKGMYIKTLWIVAAALVTFIILQLFFKNKKDTDRRYFIKLSVLLIIVVTLGQAALSFVNYGLLKERYIESTKTNTSFIAKSIQRELNKVVAKGVPAEEFGEIEQWLNMVTNAVPEIQSLYIADMRGEVLYKTQNLILMQEELIDPQYNFNLPLMRDASLKKYLINVVLSRDFHKQKLQENVVQAEIIMVIVGVFIGLVSLLLLRQKPTARAEFYQDLDSDEELINLEKGRG